MLLNVQHSNVVHWVHENFLALIMFVKMIWMIAVVWMWWSANNNDNDINVDHNDDDHNDDNSDADCMVFS